MTRPRLALLQRVARDVADVARRRRQAGVRESSEVQHPDGPTAAELARRLDETRDRLRRDIPPPDADA